MQVFGVHVELNYRMEVDKEPLIAGRSLLWGWKRSEERKLSVGRTKKLLGVM